MDTALDWVKRTLVSLGFAQRDRDILFLGLDNAGKRTLLHMLAHNKLVSLPPTVYPSCEEFKIGRKQFRGIEFGSHGPTSIHGQRFLEQASGVIFVVDSADVERVGEAKSELDALLAIEGHPKVPFLILGNKTDIPGALSEEDLRASLGVIHPTTTGKEIGPFHGERPIELFMCSIVERQGYEEGLQWLAQYIT